VTIGEPISRDLGVKEIEWELPGDGPKKVISLLELCRGLGVTLTDSEGSLMVFVNGRLIPLPLNESVSIQEGDRVEFLMPMAGG